MDIAMLFLIITLSLLAIMFFADIFPKCSLCNRIKFRACFKIHKTAGILPGYKRNKSVCRKCSRLYNIYNLSDYSLVKKIRKKAEMNVHLDR